MRRLWDQYWSTYSLRKFLAWPTEVVMSLRVSRWSGRITHVRIFDRPIHRPMIMEVERSAKGFKVYTDGKRLGPKQLKAFVFRAAPVLALLRRPDCIPTRTTVCIRESFRAQESIQEPMIAVCASREHSVVLIPDYKFLMSHGYDGLHRWAALNWRDWDSRSDSVLWRGATTGSGRISSPEMTPDHLIPRVQLCLLAKGIRGTDMKISSIVQSNSPDCDRDRFVQAGIMGKHLPVEAWVGHKFAIDIDGNTNSFGTMLQRLILGCCVLKVGSVKNWRQWYYKSVEPWVHFIPIQSDLSDFAEKIAWCREHDQECQQIAAEGRAFAHGLDCEAEKKSAVERINAAFAPSV